MYAPIKCPITLDSISSCLTLNIDGLLAITEDFTPNVTDCDDQGVEQIDLICLEFKEGHVDTTLVKYLSIIFQFQIKAVNVQGGIIHKLLTTHLGK